MRKLLPAVVFTILLVGGLTASPADAATIGIVEASGTWTESSLSWSMELDGSVTGLDGSTVWQQQPVACGGSGSTMISTLAGATGEGTVGCTPAELTTVSKFLWSRMGTELQLRAFPAHGLSLSCVLLPQQTPPASITSYSMTCTGTVTLP